MNQTTIEDTVLAYQQTPTDEYLQYQILKYLKPTINNIVHTRNLEPWLADCLDVSLQSKALKDSIKWLPEKGRYFRYMRTILRNGLSDWYKYELHNEKSTSNGGSEFQVVSNADLLAEREELEEMANRLMPVLLPREAELLGLLLQGRDIVQVATAMGITRKSCTNIVISIRHKARTFGINYQY